MAKEMCDALNGYLIKLSNTKDGDEKRKLNEEITVQAHTLKEQCCGASVTAEHQKVIATQMCINLAESIALSLVNGIEQKTMKDFEAMFSFWVHYEVNGRFLADFTLVNTRIYDLLITGYEYDVPAALSSGVMLRESTYFASVVREVLSSRTSLKLYKYTQLPNDDIATDAFKSIKTLFTVHKYESSNFMEENYDVFIQNYHIMFNDDKQQIAVDALVLLKEIFTFHKNTEIVLKYSGSADNLKLYIDFLKSPSAEVQFAAFGVFQVFVLNPNKTDGVTTMLKENKDQLLNIISQMKTLRTDDEQFQDISSYIVQIMSSL